MSLMRLLVAGASLKGIRDRRSPYKMTQQNLLPKFGSARQGEAGVADVGIVRPDHRLGLLALGFQHTVPHRVPLAAISGILQHAHGWMPPREFSGQADCPIL